DAVQCFPSPACLSYLGTMRGEDNQGLFLPFPGTNSPPKRNGVRRRGLSFHRVKGETGSHLLSGVSVQGARPAGIFFARNTINHHRKWVMSELRGGPFRKACGNCFSIGPSEEWTDGPGRPEANSPCRGLIGAPSLPEGLPEGRSSHEQPQ